MGSAPWGTVSPWSQDCLWGRGKVPSGFLLEENWSLCATRGCISCKPVTGNRDFDHKLLCFAALKWIWAASTIWCLVLSIIQLTWTCPWWVALSTTDNLFWLFQFHLLVVCCRAPGKARLFKCIGYKDLLLWHQSLSSLCWWDEQPGVEGRRWRWLNSIQNEADWGFQLGQGTACSPACLSLEKSWSKASCSVCTSLPDRSSSFAPRSCISWKVACFYLCKERLLQDWKQMGMFTFRKKVYKAILSYIWGVNSSSPIGLSSLLF